MSSPRDPWQVREGDYPVNGSKADRLRFLLNYAVLAPNSHNTQPWLFRITDEGVELLADRTRALPVVDPHDRALTISCGAALGLLGVAIRRFGHRPMVTHFPDPAEPELLARVELGEAVTPTAGDLALFEAIQQRRSNRRPYEDRPLPEELLQDCRKAVIDEGAELQIVTDPREKQRLGELVAEGDRRQFDDPRFRRELAAWVHSRRRASRDGMSAEGFGMPDLLSPVGALVIRTFDMGNGVAAQDQQIAAGSPALAALLTSQDSPQEWLRTGEALARLLLILTARGATAAYLNQPVEVEALRAKLQEVLGAQGMPQLLLRMGYGPKIEPAVRRAVDEVLI
ncbi:MAG: nitroreductase [Candidatus Competibacteraceae bacterium]|nr:nitroreductase [Candidatus Competibacteraceae bacterium]